jgi:pimeloyl-ACP methyl ester carboxylesterase
MTSHRRIVLAMAAVLVLALGACTRDPAPGPGPSASPGSTVTPIPTLPPVGVDCPELSLQGLKLHLQNVADNQIAALDFGAGPLGVVLAHQSDANMCQWLPYALLLADEGYRVLVFDFAGFGGSQPTDDPTYIDDIRTAVDYLRTHGTERVVVIGASMGATMSVVAAAGIVPALQGVIAVSPQRNFDGFDAERAASQLQVPALYVAGDDDGDYEVYATELNEATPASLRGLLIVDAPEHGVELVGAPTGPGAAVRAAIAAFLSSHLRVPATSTPPR